MPTLVVPSSVLQPPLVRPLLELLQQHLRLVGVGGTRLPPPQLLQQQFLDHLHRASDAGGRGFCGGNGSDAAAAGGADAHAHVLREAPCAWLPPKPRAGHAGALERGADAGADAGQLPLPTRALLEVLHEHVAASFAAPHPDTQYSRVAGQLWAAYTARVAALVAAGSHPQAQPRHADAHLSIRDLVLDALRHAEASVAGHGARA